VFSNDDYAALVDRFRETLEAILPASARVLVVSKGDDALLEIDGRLAAHFPQHANGNYGGHHPRTGAAAVEALTHLRDRGFEYIAFPASSLWWLEHYSELHQFLENHGYLIEWSDDTCVVYGLTAGSSALRDVGRALSARSRQVQAMLEEAVDVSPPPSTLSSRDAYEQLLKTRLQVFLESDAILPFPNVKRPRASVVIPVHNKAFYTLEVLCSLLAHWGDYELIVVNNGSSDETSLVLERTENVVIRHNSGNLGFGEACNGGAALARGNVICFLNNDTLVTPAWLERLSEALLRNRRTGAVGPRLIHPDGRLQEAGGIVWEDGSNWGFGRGQDPFAPAFSYRREVDYCSAACLAVRRAAFERTGGFDSRYAPAYYEDVDLCWMLQAQGLRIVYEPTVTIIHTEFGSTDRNAGVAQQLVNRAQFVDKWRDRLNECPAADDSLIFRRRDARQGLRVLVVDDRVPASYLGSGFPRARALLEFLVAKRCVVSFLPVANRSHDQADVSSLEAAGVEVMYGDAEIADLLGEREGLFDVAMVSRPHNGHYIPLIRELNPDASVIYDAEAIFAARDILHAELEGRPFSDQEGRALIAREIALADGADVVIATSDKEAEIFRTQGRMKNVSVIGDVVDRYEGPGLAGRSGFLFVGNLATPPNIDAVRYLLKDIFNVIRSELDCRLKLAGIGAEVLGDEVDVRGDGIELIGFCSDLKPCYDQARVFLAPHRFAAGLPHKVVEAMAHGLPCVISELLAEQLGVVNGREALVARTTEDFAAKAVQLYSDDALWLHIREGANSMLDHRFTRAAMRRRFWRAVSRARQTHRVTGQRHG
jgi:GT2 family glycosyltransferase